MKSLRMALLATVAITAAGLVACGKTSNNAASGGSPASTCTQSWDGTLRDQYGRSCGNYGYNANSCVNTRYDATTGRYLNVSTGQPVNCQSNGYFDGYNSVPYYGQYGSQQINGCSGWTQVYGASYVPIDFGNGQLVCMNTAYLQQYNPGYNWNQIYYTQRPVYTCYSSDCYGGSYGGYGSNYGYGCNSSFNIGAAFSGFGMNFGFCTSY